MDPVSISVSVLAIITACAQIVKILKETIETLKKAAEFLLQLLSQTERVRLFLEQLRSLTEQLRARSDILLAFSPSGPQATINELNVFVRDMAQKPKLMKLKMLLKRSTADELVKRLHRHEVEITQVLLSVATASAIRTEEEIQRMRDDALFRAKVTFPFSSETSTLVDSPGAQVSIARSSTPKVVENSEDKGKDAHDASNASPMPQLVPSDTSDLIDLKENTAPLADAENLETDSQDAGNVPITSSSSTLQTPSTEDQMHESSSTSVGPLTPNSSYTETLQGDSDPDDGSLQDARRLPIWFGDLSRPGFEDSYLSLRDQLSDAAYLGAFDRMFSVLAEAERTYRQSWANAPRLSRNPHQSSGWTPLHQAVFMGAHKDRIVGLIEDFGALRLLRTAWTNSGELPYRDMTAAEIARELGFTDLYDILAPIIYHCVPSAVLAMLQTHFHDLIRFDLRGATQELTTLRLPELVVLTELRMPMMWFPLKSRRLNGVRGYMYRLDGRELLIKSFGISQPTPDERPEKCPIPSCEYHHRGFAREYDKRRHTLTHFRGTLVCAFCPASSSLTEKTFERADFFKRHLVSVHSVEPIPPNSESQSQAFTRSARELLSQYGDGSGDCSICCATFANAQEFYEHLDDCVLQAIQQLEPTDVTEPIIEAEDQENTRIYRISERGVVEIEEAIAFNA